MTNETSEGGFMAGAAAREERDLRSTLARTEVDDFLRSVDGDGGVGEVDGLKGGVDELNRVVEEVFDGHCGWLLR